MYSFDPAKETIEHLGDLTEACGEKELKAVPQGKSHVRFVESNGKLYFATHLGYYSIKKGMETIGDPPPNRCLQIAFMKDHSFELHWCCWCGPVLRFRASS
jgi:hypothetical protein